MAIINQKTKNVMGRPRKEPQPEATTDTPGQSQQTAEPTPETSAPKEASTATTPGKRVLIWRDRNGIIRTNHDLKAVCGYFNGFLDKLRSLDLLPLGLTDEMTKELCFYNPAPFIEALEKTAEPTNTTNRLLKKLSAQTLATDVEKVTKMIADLQNTMQREKLKSGLCLEETDRANYLKVQNDCITYDPEEVTEYFSRYAETPEALSYIAEARQLFDSLCKFDEKTRKLSRGKVRGLGDNESGTIPEIIVVYGGKIRLDLAPVDEIFTESFKSRFLAPGFDKGDYAVINPER